MASVKAEKSFETLGKQVQQDSSGSELLGKIALALLATNSRQTGFLRATQQGPHLLRLITDGRGRLFCTEAFSNLAV
jgi:hypothetical protein